MSHSLNEIEAMAKKAARGAGMSWGSCEEAGKAARWLESHNRNGVAELARLCDAIDGRSELEFMPHSIDRSWVSGSGTLGPIVSGAALNDNAEVLRDGAISLNNVAFPLLFVPFAAWAAIHLSQPVQVSWGSIIAVSDGYKLSISDPSDQFITATAVTVTVSIADVLPETAMAPETRGQVDPAAYAALAKFAHRTYAPATEESRMLGAGAGVTDND